MAIVLDGGGGKGAYQVGVLRALKEKGLLENVKALSGASIGAVNAFLYAMDDIDIMYRAWEDIDMLTLFDFDLELLLDKSLHFSRDEMLKLIERYIDFDKLISGKYDIYIPICRLDGIKRPITAEYRRIGDYTDESYIKKLLLASTALPVMYEAVMIDGSYYRDGGICDNEPIKPLYDAGYREFIVIGMTKGKKIATDKWPDADFTGIFPSSELGNLFFGTLNFTENKIKYAEALGYKDGLRAIKSKFHQYH